MIALCVDGDARALRALAREVGELPEIASVAAFGGAAEALAWAGGHPFDVALLETELGGAEPDGLALARRLLALRPEASVVFCAASDRRAVEALALHVDAGYLLKPVDRAKLAAEIAHAAGRHAGDRRLRVVCFGSFEVFSGDRPLKFARRKSRELFAYLVDRRGAETGTNELCAVLWPDETDDARNRDYLYHLIADLKRALRGAGAEAALRSRNRGYAIDVNAVDCDYYHLLDGDPAARRAFAGEYMHRYSWAESTCAWLLANYGRRR